MTKQPPTLTGCDVLPPLQTSADATESQQAKGKPSRSTRNRFAVLNAFVDAAAGELSRSELLVWLTLYRDTRHGIACTSQADIARRSRLSERTIRYAIKRLEGRGLLTLVYRGGINRGPSKYRVRIE